MSPPEGCWRLIGVSGDRSCPELLRVVHCRNCEVLTRAAEALLERPAPPDYARFFTGLVAAAPAARPQETSVVVFRIGGEWLALPTYAFVEFADVRPIRRIAHRTHTLVSGLVNVRGQLLLAVALDRLLEIPAGAEGTTRARPRLAVIAVRGDTWAFPVAEVSGVERFATASLEAPPATLAPSLSAVTRGVFPAGERRITFLHAENLGNALGTVAR